MRTVKFLFLTNILLVGIRALLIEKQLGGISNYKEGPNCQIPATFPNLIFATLIAFSSFRSEDFPQSPAPDNLESTVIDYCQVDCVPNCCSDSICETYFNANGDQIAPDKDYTIIYGGIDKTQSQNMESCFGQPTPDTCLTRAKNDLYMLSQAGTLYHIQTYGVTPPQVYGHSAAFKEQDDTKYIYYFGGRSPDCPNNICNELFRLEIPYAPIGLHPSGNRFEKVEHSSSQDPNLIPTGLFGHSMSISGDYIVIVGGIKLTNEGQNNYSEFNFFIFNLLAQEWMVPEKQLLVEGALIKTWDGSEIEARTNHGKPLGRILPLISIKQDRSKIYIFSGLVRDETQNEFVVYNDKYSLNMLSWDGGAQYIPRQLKSVSETYINIIENKQFCWTFDQTILKWFVSTSLEEVENKSQIRILNLDDEEDFSLNVDDAFTLHGSDYSESSAGCSITVSGSKIFLLNQKTFRATIDSTSNPNIEKGVFGLNFCKGNLVGNDCQLTCPFSFTMSK